MDFILLRFNNGEFPFLSLLFFVVVLGVWSLLVEDGFLVFRMNLFCLSFTDRRALFRDSRFSYVVIDNMAVS